ncbi:VanZ family protein [Arthrobacter sp. G119Y2]|uniref:VanZ family protein n=1 Tax=Arthrobacter sp. G119Y2 TaxID=3134965 RepID=UPI00311A698A
MQAGSKCREDPPGTAEGKRRPAAGSHGARRAFLGLAAAAVLAGMGAVLLTPGPVDQPVYGTVLRALRRLQEHGLPGWVDYTAVEAAANVLLFVPLGLLAGLLLPARRWWLGLLLCVGLAAGAEISQDLFLPRRQGDLQDVLNNGAGALLGVAVAAAGRTLRSSIRRGRTLRAVRRGRA